MPSFTPEFIVTCKSLGLDLTTQSKDISKATELLQAAVMDFARAQGHPIQTDQQLSRLMELCIMTAVANTTK